MPNNQEGRGQWNENYTGPPSYDIFTNFDWVVQTSRAITFSTNNFDLEKG